MLGSPTALADEDLEKTLYNAANEHNHGLYVPSGALWGGEDIRKMAERGSLKGKLISRHLFKLEILSNSVQCCRFDSYNEKTPYKFQIKWRYCRKKC